MATSAPQVGQLPDHTHRLCRGLVGWWPFFEKAGSHACDVSLFNRNADFNSWNPSFWQWGVQRGSFMSDREYLYCPAGGGDMISVPDSVLTDIDSRSVSVWFAYPNSTTLPTGIDLVVGSDFASGRMYIGCESSNWYFRVGSGAGTQVTHNNTGQEFHLLVATQDAPSGECFAYVDGKQFSLPNSTTKASELALFALANGGNQMLGCVSDFRVYDRVLSPDEIMEMYCDPWAPFEPKRVLHVEESSGGVTVTPSTVAATFGVPSVTTAFANSPAAVSQTVSVPTPSTSLSNTPSPVSAALGVPSVSVGGEIAVDPVSAAFSVATPTTQIAVTPASVVANWSVPVAGVPITVEPSPLTATFAVPAVSIGERDTPDVYYPLLGSTNHTAVLRGNSEARPTLRGAP